MAAVRDQLEDFGPDVDVVVVTFAQQSNLDPYVKHHEFPFTMLMDPGLEAYNAFGIGRGTVRRVWGWRMVKRYLEIYRQDGFELPGKATEDTLQLGGDFIIDPNGQLIYGYWSEGPDDRPSVPALTAAIENNRR